MRRLRWSLVLAAVTAALVAAPASAEPTVNGVFDMQGVTTNGQLTVGPDGNIWVALEAAVAKVEPNGTVTPFNSTQLGNALGVPSGGITSAGGFIWVSQPPNGGKKAIVKIPPGNPADAVGVDVTDVDAGATAMTTGPDGNVWLAFNKDGLSGKIVKFSPADPTVRQTFFDALLAPRGMTTATDGTLWVTDTANGGRLLNVQTTGGENPVTVGGQPQFVAAGPAGLIAYGNPNSTPQQIGLLKPGGSPQTLDRPNGSDPFGVAFGADGAFWVAEFAGNRLARVTTDGQLTTLSGFPTVTGQGPRQIVAGPNNTLWATLDKPGDPANTKIARITGVDPPPTTTDPGTGAGPGPTPGDQTPTDGGTPPPPPPDTIKPAISSASLSKTKIRRRTAAIRLRFRLSEAAKLQLTLSRAVTRNRRTRYVRVRTIAANGTAGQNAIRIATRKLRAGRYRVVLRGTDAAGNRSDPVTRTFRVTA